MKIKMTKEYQGLEKGKVYDLDDMTANVLASKFVCVREVKAPEKPKPVVDKPLAKCNLGDLQLIVEKEVVDIGDATTKKDIVAAIEAHRESVLMGALEQQCLDLGIENNKEMDKDQMTAAIEQKIFENNLGDRTVCDDTCEYAKGEECTRPENCECGLAE